MSRRPPVIDWSADFDHLDPRWTENPYPIWDELRQKCPIAHTERFMGAYFATRYEDVRTIAYDTEHFSSRRPVVRETRPPLTPAPSWSLCQRAGALLSRHSAAIASSSLFASWRVDRRR
jgi:cytochrome P450